MSVSLLQCGTAYLTSYHLAGAVDGPGCQPITLLFTTVNFEPGWTESVDWKPE